MAANSTQKLQLCSIRSDESESESFIVPIDVNKQFFLMGRTSIPFSQKITLAQEPNEIVILSFSINFNQHYNCRTPYHHCDLSLTFDNNLHEMSQDYVYVVKLNMLKVNLEQNYKYHVNIFSHEEKRSDKVIAANNQLLFNMNFSRNDVLHLFCPVRRFNQKDTRKIFPVELEQY